MKTQTSGVRWVMVAVLGLALVAVGCGRSAHAVDQWPEPKVDLPAPEGEPGQTRTAVLAAGCFWCVEAMFEPVAGVTEVVSGYAGGSEAEAQYELVSRGSTDHAEAVRVTYDPAKVSYGDLLRVFFATHDPTTKDRQGPDWGRQYRSTIFYADEDEKRVAEAYIGQLNEAKVFDKKIVTTLEPLKDSGFYPAEKYHQDFVKNNPDHPYVRQWVPDKIKKLQKYAGDLLEDASAKKAGE